MSSARIIYLTYEQHHDPKRLHEIAKQVRYCLKRKGRPNRNGNVLLLV